MSFFDEMTTTRLGWPRAGHLIRFPDGVVGVPIHMGERHRLMLTDSREARELAVAATIAAQALEVEEGLTAGDRTAAALADQESEAGQAAEDAPADDEPGPAAEDAQEDAQEDAREDDATGPDTAAAGTDEEGHTR